MSSVAGPVRTGPPPTASTTTFVATFAGVLAITAVMLFIDFALARVDRRESDAHAASEYQTGVELLAAGRAAEAAEHFGTAVSVDRSNNNYALALGEAMLAEGHPDEAEATLKGLLDRAENDGSVNLAMARVMIRESRFDDAKAYYHRAIFGRWGADSSAGRTQSREELIGLLGTHGTPRELLAELLPFEATSPDSVEMRRRVAHLFIVAGSPARALALYRELLQRNPRDGDALAGIGEASLELGNFATARADLAERSGLLPQDTAVARRLALADTLIALDPDAKGLDAGQRASRSRIVLARVAAVVQGCGVRSNPALLDSARASLAVPVPRTPTARVDSAGDAAMSLAAGIWSERSRSCDTSPGRDNAVRLLFGRPR